jgi:predicted  nucleic acid-binding Zn-ribbon protein
MNTNAHKAPYRDASGALDFLKRIAWNLLPSGFRERMHKIETLDEATKKFETVIAAIETKLDRIVGSAMDELAIQRRLAAYEGVLADFSERLVECERSIRQIEDKLERD